MTGNASLSHPNFEYVSTVFGSSGTTKILGIGGLGSEGLIAEARENLMRNAGLRDGEALANVSVDVVRGYYLLVLTEKVLITAHKVRFLNEDSTHIPKLVTKFNSKIVGRFNWGEEVYYSTSVQSRTQAPEVFRAQIIRNSSGKGLKLATKDRSGRVKFQQAYQKYLFKIERESGNREYYNGYEVGDKVNVHEWFFDDQGENVGKKFPGEIIGLGEDFALVRYQKEGESKMRLASYIKTRPNELIWLKRIE